MNGFLGYEGQMPASMTSFVSSWMNPFICAPPVTALRDPWSEPLALRCFSNCWERVCQ